MKSLLLLAAGACTLLAKCAAAKPNTVLFSPGLTSLRSRLQSGTGYHQEQFGVTAGGRGVITEKIVIGWHGEPVEFCRCLHWETLRGWDARGPNWWRSFKHCARGFGLPSKSPQFNLSNSHEKH